MNNSLLKPLENRKFAKSKPDTQVEGAAAYAETKVDPWVHTRYTCSIEAREETEASLTVATLNIS